MPSEAQRRRGMVLMPLAYRVEDAAAAIGISRSTLFEYIKHGRIPSRKIGNSTVIRHCDLEARYYASTSPKSVEVIKLRAWHLMIG